MINMTKEPVRRKKTRNELLDEAVPQFETFIESRENYIKALETAIEALRKDNRQANDKNLAIRSSIDELVAMQQLSNIISTASDPELIVGTLIELTRQVIPLIESNIFLFEASSSKLIPLSSKGSLQLYDEAQRQVEGGIVDWVIGEKRTIVIPDPESAGPASSSRIYVVVPLLFRNQALGIYVIHSSKPQEEFSNQHMQLLSILANQAAVGIENWRTYQQLLKVNEELKASQAQIVQAAKLAAIGELAASIVHEIKNPIQIILMHMELLQRGKPLPNWLDLLGEQIKRLSEITKRLMNFSREVSEDVPMEAVSVSKAVEEIIAIVQHEFRNINIEIVKQLRDDLPPVTGNSNYLQQVFINLLINARDAMPGGGTITVSTESSGYHNIIKFSDTGSGIDRENLTKIFMPFFTTKQEGSGTGLGLPICRKIISQHRGEIKVESTLGKGTTFTIFLPIRRRVT